jgi:dTDP-4-amino-4,6-dideoxygalactose transaminase
MPSFTFVTTATSFALRGATPVFVDIREDTLNLDVEAVAAAIGPATKAIVAVHYAGVACDMDALTRLAADAGVTLIEDAAQAIMSERDGRPLGAIGELGALSFHETKNVTCGEGGALALMDPELAQRAEVIREKGTNRTAFLRGEVDKYTWVAEGSSYVLSDVLAALLDAQLDKMAEIQSRRARVAARYRSELADWASRHGVRLPPCLPDRVDNAHLFYLLYPGERERDRALQLLRSCGVQAAFHYVPLHAAPHGRALGLDRAPLPVTERVAATLLRLPLHPLLSDGDVERVVDAVRRTLP